MVHKKHTRYTKDFKQQIVDLYNAGTPVVQLANEYGLVEQTLYKWIKTLSPSIKTDEGEQVSMKEYKELQMQFMLHVQREVAFLVSTLLT